MDNQLSKDLRSFTAKEIIEWAWKHDIPEVPYEKSFEITGPIYKALESRGIAPSHKVFMVSENILFEILQDHKSEIFMLIPGGINRETHEKLNAMYWASVEADEERLEEKFWEEWEEF